MNEAEWTICADSESMLGAIFNTISERQLRQFACACCRRIIHMIVDTRGRNAIEAAEKFADGMIGDQELADAREAARIAYIERSQTKDDHASAAAYYCAVQGKSMLPAAINRVLASLDLQDQEKAAQADLLRKLIENPFQRIEGKA
ncbi:hypothetical protein [Tuwongella immobilis]|uniref:hypothetical protein n=1 Tax=Tuwongella immobilis TaxID=692036 RepID=UPI001E52F982|nr:hypothetical protein [Tuwongella immobilis]